MKNDKRQIIDTVFQYWSYTRSMSDLTDVTVTKCFSKYLKKKMLPKDKLLRQIKLIIKCIKTTVTGTKGL